MTNSETARDRDMILHPLKWPHLALPLVRQEGGYAVFYPPMRDEIGEDEPIQIIIGALLFLPAAWDECGRHTYPNVDALLADGWRVD